MDVKIKVPDPLDRDRRYFLSRVEDLRNDVLDWFGPQVPPESANLAIKVVDTTIEGMLNILDGGTAGEPRYVLLPMDMLEPLPAAAIPNIAGGLAETYTMLFEDVNS